MEQSNKYHTHLERKNGWFDMNNFGIIFMEEVNGKFVLLGTDF